MSDELRSALRDGDRVLVSEAALRRRFPGWRVPDVEWHLGRVCFIYREADGVSIPQHGVSVAFEGLREGEWRLPIAATEVEMCVEAMAHAFSMFRTSEEWQRIGAVGRWFSAWIQLWRAIGGTREFTMIGWDPGFRPGETVTVAGDPASGVFMVKSVQRGTVTLIPF